MVIQCKNLISLYILPDQRRVNLLVSIKIFYPYLLFFRQWLFCRRRQFTLRDNFVVSCL